MSFAVAVAPLAYVLVSFAAVGVVYYAFAGVIALVRALGGGGESPPERRSPR